ncbi:AMP-binding protein [Nocardia sp. NPDC056000]|uniref:AMP-binding protein n=1 Tax=Nocardia sp. NPDC056000 TaxID=3345674 RepID=UPI0035D67035
MNDTGRGTASPTAALADAARYWVPLTRAALRTVPVRRAPATVAALRHGVGLATLLALSAARHPDRPAVIDDEGAITAEQLQRRVIRLAAALRDDYDVGPGSKVAVLCRNHRGFVEGLLAGARLSADLVPMNYDFPGPQLRGVIERDGIDVLIYDAEFHQRVEHAGFTGVRVIAKHGGLPPVSTVSGAPVPAIDELVARTRRAVVRPARGSQLVILTSGSTGTPKGALRRMGIRELREKASYLHPRLLMLAAEAPRFARLRAIPIPGRPMVLAPPMHHVMGMLGLVSGLATTSPLIMTTRFSPEWVLASIEKHRATAAFLVPTMIKRIMDLPVEVRTGYDTASLVSVPSGAMPLPPHLGTEFMDAYGDILFNAYASTEIGPCTVALPEDLRAAPGTVGRPIRGLVRLRLLDDNGTPVPPDITGRIFNRNPFQFSGYSGGGGKEVIDGFMSTGDVGHFDSAGRLFIDGRDDEMIVSGGENVYPQEVEETLLTHPAIAEVAVWGVPDADFGQRLAAFIVRKPTADLTPEEVRAHVNQNLARYKVPRDVHFVQDLPRTTTGKLKHKALTDLAESLGSPEH